MRPASKKVWSCVHQFISLAKSDFEESASQCVFTASIKFVGETTDRKRRIGGNIILYGSPEHCPRYKLSKHLTGLIRPLEGDIHYGKSRLAKKRTGWTLLMGLIHEWSGVPWLAMPWPLVLTTMNVVRQVGVEVISTLTATVTPSSDTSLSHSEGVSIKSPAILIRSVVSFEWQTCVEIPWPNSRVGPLIRLSSENLRSPVQARSTSHLPAALI